MSFFRYGNYQHPDNEVNLVRYEVRQIPSPRGKRMEKEIRMYLMGEIQATGATLLSRIADVIAAYDHDYEDASYWLNSTTKTRHVLDNAPSVSGVRVIQRSWPVGDGAELAVKRTFSLTLAAIYEDLDSQLLFWAETLRLIGTCGPRVEVVDTVNGPVDFQTMPKTKQRIIQKGRSVGYKAYVLPPGPLFPSIEHQDVREIELGSGRNRGQYASGYQTDWIYRMTSGSPKDAVPTTR